MRAVVEIISPSASRNGCGAHLAHPPDSVDLDERAFWILGGAALWLIHSQGPLLLMVLGVLLVALVGAVLLGVE